ncbi:MAG: FKBP-type peptidyl-prolyl cis-trans isomerase, partial [archaeon]|nr:FKBP-type peptidyl-prolyl cis-trans isomerase [archaeon]
MPIKKTKSTKASPKKQAKKEKAAAVREKPKERRKDTEKHKEQEKTGKSKTKINAKSIIAVVIIAVIALYFLGSIQDTDTPQTDDEHAVKTGDKVYIKFTQKLENGTILDTNYEDIAKEAGIAKNKYPPLIFIVGKGQVPGGLENALVGMKVGGKKTVILEPKDAYGEYKTELAGVADRVQYKERNLTVVDHEHLTSKEFTELFRKTAAILGDTVSTHAISWKYTITDVKPDNITVKAIIKRGSVHKLPDIPWNCT